MKYLFRRKLHKRVEDLYSIEPTDLGLPVLNMYYRRMNKYFKTAPFVVIVPITFIFAAGVVFLFGIAAVKLVSILQYAF